MCELLTIQHLTSYKPLCNPPDFSLTPFVVAILLSAASVANAQKPEPPSIPGLGTPAAELTSGVLTNPIHIGKAKATTIRISPGEKPGTINVTFSLSEFGFNAFGDPVPRPNKADSVRNVTFSLSANETVDPLKQGRKRYSLVSTTKGESEGEFALVAPAKAGGQYALLLLDKDGKTSATVALKLNTLPLPPCHPGCFPAGTLINTPTGTKAIESIVVGDEVTTIAAGKPVVGKVVALFGGESRLVEIETAAGKLVCTPKQPLHLASGETKSAGQVVAGDKLLRWVDGKVVPTEIVSLKTGEIAATIHNLILAERGTFVADGYMVKSKPPAEK